ncbi:MAG: GPR endopeptidase [Oscillospiraceae bacterium]|nr:GPR endopeptidase [Oscillospiraceae bacterium]
MTTRRTDLATEARELFGEEASALPGVESGEEVNQGYPITTVRVTTAEGARALGKPEGVYHTLDLTALHRREEGAFPRAVEAIKELLVPLIPKEGTVLVVGLGNRAITPDAVGPKTVDRTLVTRHLIQMAPEQFGDFRPVCALAAGVLGTTGVESGELAKAVCDKISPCAVIAVDALCARRVERLCVTIQVCDTGISPGSGVGNHRFSLNRESLGVPVIALGVPTVVEGATLCADILEDVGRPTEAGDLSGAPGASLFVTPKDIDQRVEDMSKVLSHAISLALQPQLTLEDLEALIE